jgi:hypothetical protein
MIETKEKEIGDAVYSVTQMPAIRALKIQSRLLRLVGPSFAAMIASGEDSSIPMAISLLTDKLDENTFEKLVLDLMQGVRKDGAELTKGKIDLEFAGNLNELYRVLQFVLEVNFADFFQDGGIIAELKKAAEKETPLSPDLKKI